jgi:membrane-bound lytic murein transglycosylase D
MFHYHAVMNLDNRIPLSLRLATAVAALALLTGEAVGQGWEVDWDTVTRIGTTVAKEIEKSPLADQIASLSNQVGVDWELIGRLIEQALDDTSWEQVAALRPYGEMALQRLAQVEGGEPLAAWFLQRLAYLQVAEQYTQPPAPPPPPPPKLPDTTPPRPPVPAVRPPVPRKHKVNLEQDMKTWTARLPASPVPLAVQLAPDLKAIFKAEGVPGELIWLAEVESAFNPRAKSPVGAVGLFQFMPATAARFGLQATPDDQRTDPRRSAAAAARYLRLLHGRFADWPLAVAAYNAGEGRVGRTLKKQGGQTFEEIADALPIETRMYVPRVAAVILHREGADLRLLPSPAR